jgi:bacterioferritin
MPIEKAKTIAKLNQIVEHELAGAVRYTQYSLMVFGHARIPIIGWMREQANESLMHACQAGEEVTTLGGKVSLEIGELAGTHHETVDEMLEKLVAHERAGIALYEGLRKLTEGKSIPLEEMARQMLRAEAGHVSEIEKMLRNRGDA